MSANMKDLKRRMEGALENLAVEFQGLRTGRASTDLLTPIHVDAYGASMPLNQVASIAAPEPRMLSVTVWDNSMVKAVEKAIRESDLGLNPMTEGNVMRIPLPELNEERRTELTRVAGKYAEQARIAIRNIRRDGMDTLKRQEKDGEIGQDELHRGQDDIQKLTDEYVAKVDTSLADKEKDIMQV
ncbi:MAG: ribosome recycling factor [Alphaproteobacteria bacterium]|uniref:ribosome recycling factor n=1 Tax=Pacificispira sp. TaxID=2888761 RepID=UPI001B2725AE|nr:ribosome recycling factor [Alphaproteobacteria bacterium]MBO6862736.1 ribosome recycling factor [Alphaproteobacteria bacterium]